MTEKLSRRSFLTLQRGPRPEAGPPSPATGAGAEEPAATFSLASFYAGRVPSNARIPVFAVRAPTVPVPTTAVGVACAALTPVELVRGPRAGVAQRLGGPVAVVPSACLAWQGTPCRTCSERCPVENAITLDAERPAVDPLLCDGCGECVAACPAPHNALKLAAHFAAPQGATT